MSEPLDPRRRLVRFVDERGLLMAPSARLADRRLCLVVNPVSAFRATSPANVVAFGANGIAWALPLDFARLALATTTRPAALVYDAFWTLVERFLGSQTAGPGPVWLCPTGVGDQPDESVLRDPASGPWVEYRGARPWIGLGRVGSLQLLAPANRPNDSTGTEPDRAYRVRVLADDIHPDPGSRVLLRRDSMVDLSHFAVLDPAVEGWTREGLVGADAVAALRQQFLRWAGG